MSGRPRILVAIKGLGIGGAERLISESARYWDRDQFDYHVAYALPWKDQLVSHLLDLGIQVHCTGTVWRSSMPSISGLRRTIREIRPDLVHAHSPTVGIVARWISTTPVVYTEHNLANSYHPATRLSNRLTYGRNAAAIAVSEPVADSVRKYPGTPPIVILNGVDCRVDPIQAKAARAELGIGPESPLVVHVGNIRPGKGHATLIDATTILRGEIPDVMVVSIGGEKRVGDLARVSSMLKERDLADTFHLLGRREDALAFVQAADVFVNPAEVEGLPVALLEAMALGRPVVATAVGGVPNLVRHGENGLLVEALSSADLAAAVNRLLVDRAYAATLGASARVDVERDHGLKSMVRRIETVYVRVLSQRG